ncbi:AraC family transcriptional regulator ligand-binding domain-containing protein [Candidatus Halobeggiatoa sp. HSG11]|nr:AraC family transcriptional regulator ligand-binding domain-containing protein [Candidatus Halobeggiatoa sp. HSG11]
MSSSDEHDKPTEPPVKSHFLASFANITTFFAASIGISLKRIVKKTGLKSPAILMNPDAHIPQEFFERLLHLIDETFPEKNMSLELVRNVPLAFLGSPGRVFKLSPDLGTWLDLFVQNSDVFSEQLEVELSNTDEEVILHIYHPLNDNDTGASAEVGVGMGVRVVRELFSDNAIARIQFKHAARSQLSFYENYFKAPITFQAEFNALIFHRDALEQRNKNEHTETRKSLEWRFANLRQELGLSDADVLANIRKAIAYNAKKGEFSVFRLAQRMDISSRSLQRRANKAGTSTQVLLDEARYDKALELLADEHISIEEMAIKLGFSNKTNFHKAFQRWSQKTPNQVRREMRDEK